MHAAALTTPTAYQDRTRSTPEVMKAIPIIQLPPRQTTLASHSHQIIPISCPFLCQPKGYRRSCTTIRANSRGQAQENERHGAGQHGYDGQ